MTALPEWRARAAHVREGRVVGLPQWLATLAVAFLVFGDLPIRLRLGGVSLNALTVGIFGLLTLSATLRLAWGHLHGPDARSGRVALRNFLRWPVAPFVGFVAWAGVALVRSHFDPFGVQQFAIYLLFVGTIIVGGWSDPAVDERQLLQALIIGSWVGAAAYSFSLALWGLNSNGAYSARSFGLMAVLMVAITLARPGRPGRSAHALLPYLLFGLVVLSLSRTAMVVIEVLIVLWWGTRRRGWAGVRAGCVAAAVAAGVGYVLVEGFAPLRARFFTGDVHALTTVPTTSGGLQASGASVADSTRIALPAVNLQGRGHMWEVVWQSARHDLWLGRGLGTASEAIRGRYPGLTQPHDDFLRFLHDTGAIGLSLWLLGTAAVAGQLWKVVRRSPQPRARGSAWAALAGLAGLSATMLTDNTAIYSFVMVPLAVLIGVAMRQARVAGGRVVGASRSATPVDPG